MTYSTQRSLDEMRLQAWDEARREGRQFTRLGAVTARDCVRIASTVSGVNADLIASPNRSHKVASARYIAMWLARYCAGMSFPQIGAALDRDHSTIVVGVRKSTQRSDLQPALRTARAAYYALRQRRSVEVANGRT